MEVAQDSWQAAHVVGVGVGKGNRIESADAARPEHFRHHFFADVEILRRLMRTASKSAAIDEQSLPVGSDQQQRVALADIDGLKKQRVARVVDGSWGYGCECSHDQSSPDKA